MHRATARQGEEMNRKRRESRNEQVTIEEMKRFKEKTIKSPRKAKAFLMRAGICTKTGRLTKNYR